ncbi:hypothetical protein [Arsenophonus sp. PmNCSU2021_1]|uniref:hypothetical protein n=1 Tax=Arsenophonus sp. PmNCSU2021_1 TaxID=3118989 RepID=UPI002FF0D011
MRNSCRYDKDGQIVGEVTQADVEDNLQRLARRNKSTRQSTDAHADLALGK